MLSHLLRKALAGPSPDPPADGNTFPPGFLWGVSTSAYQIEGAVHEDGRGTSIWDTFAHTPGKIANGDTADIADDHFHRYPADIALMQQLGVRANSMTVSWSRIFPHATGAPNQRGLDFYDRLLDALLAAGITPFCTLFHWELPQVLQDRGGWLNRDTASAFADYAGFTAGRLGDRVEHFLTINEPRSFIELGLGTGLHAPGLRLGRAAVAQAAHIAMLAHGLAVQSIRAHTPARTRIGIVDNTSPCIPVIDTPEHRAAARLALREENAPYLTVLQGGRYTEGYLRRLGPDAPTVTPADLQSISTPIDFLGLNIYAPVYVRAGSPSADPQAGYTVVPPPSSFPHMRSPWLTFGPEAAYWLPRLVTEVWGRDKTLYVHENGASADDLPAPDGTVYDVDRITYLRACLTHLQRAVSEGFPVRGYFVWSLIDNFEWADGYTNRFGLFYVDYATQSRTPKLSARFFQHVIAHNRLA